MQMYTAEIIIGTTPTITYKFKLVPPSDINTAILTIVCGGSILIEKTLEEASVGEDTLSWTLSQEETLSLGTRSAKMMLNWKTESGLRGASRETSIKGVTNHKKEVI